MFKPEQLRDKALLALEEAVQECRYRTPRRSHALRFALAYLWHVSGSADRRPFDELWRAIGEPKSPWSFSSANGRLLAVYVAIGLKRDDEIGMELWRRLQEEESGDEV